MPHQRRLAPRLLLLPVYEYVAPAPIITDLESVLEPPVPVVHTAPAPLIKYVAPAPDVTCAVSANTDLVSPAPVTECIAPTRVAPSFSDLVNSQFSTAYVEAFAPGSPFLTSVSQAYQDQIVAGETTLNIVGSIPVIEEQIGDIPVPPIVEETVEVVHSLPQERLQQRIVDQEQIVAEETTQNISRTSS